MRWPASRRPLGRSNPCLYHDPSVVEERASGPLPPLILGLILLALLALGAAPVVAQTSCAVPGPNGEPNMCGLRFQFEHEPGLWLRTGCSCEPDCGFYGTCCSDLAQVCGSADGTQWVQGTLDPTGAASHNGGGNNGRYVLVDDGTSAVGLSRVRLVDIDSRGEHSECRALPTAAGYWAVSAITDYDDNHATCAAQGLRWPAGELALGPAHEVSAGDGSVRTITLPDFPASTSLPLLQWVRMEDIDGGDTTSCRLQVDAASDRWQLQAWSAGDSNSWCSARLLDLEGSNARVASHCPTDRYAPDPAGGSYTTCADGVFAVYLNENSDNGTTALETSLLSESRYTCFLTQVAGAGQNDPQEPLDCQVQRKFGRWWLAAETDNAWTYCEARCLEQHASQAGPSPTGWPPLPTKIVVDATTPTAGAWGYGSWGEERLEPGGEDVIVDETLGPRLELYQSGAYDLPVVFFQGFDPSNDNSGPYHLRFLAPLLRVMMPLGIDLWFVELDDGGQSVIDIARRNARALQIAYEHEAWGATHPGKEMVAVGISMGAFTGRFLMSSWEQGLYGPGGDEAVPGIVSAEPPISLFAAVSGPQEGGNIPLSIQMAVRDAGRSYDLGKQEVALASRAAEQMLNERIAASCRNVVTEECDFIIGTAQTFIDQTTRIFGQRVFRSGNGGHPPGCVNSNQCPGYDGCFDYPPSGGKACGFDYTPECPIDNAQVHQSLYDDVNTRGPRGDGFPATVKTLGIASGTFAPQSRAAFAKGISCSAWDPNCSVSDPLGQHTVLASMAFRDVGHTFLDLCDRDSFVFGHPTAADLEPGDVSGRSLADIDFGELPEQVTMLDVRQHFPFMHIPTTSALACPGSTSHAQCKRSSPFDFKASSDTAIHPDEIGHNNGHERVFDYHAVQLLGWVADGYFGDADGFCDASNPFAPLLREFRQAAGVPVHAGCFDKEDLAPDDPNSSGPIFADGFESGDLSAWSHVVD